MARRSIDIESFQHANPIPAATRIGPLVTCSITPPFEVARGTPRHPRGPDREPVPPRRQDAGGGRRGWDDVARMTFYVKDPRQVRCEAVERAVGERFPDPASAGPLRHNIEVADHGSPALISCDFIAYVEELSLPGAEGRGPLVTACGR